jgi:hypothetical protein
MSTKIEYHHFVIPITESIQDELKKLIEAGWAPIPGATPIAIWHMQRLQGAEQHFMAVGAQAGVSVKDEGITIIRGSSGDAPKIN